MSAAGYPPVPDRTAMGFLADVVELLEDAGHEARVETPLADVRGDAPRWSFVGGVERAWLEERVDLGPLAGWRRRPTGRWDLVDVSRPGWGWPTITGFGGRVPLSDPAPAGRRLLASASQEPRLRRAYPVPTRRHERAVLAGEVDGAAEVVRLGGHLGRRALRARSRSAGALRARLLEAFDALTGSGPVPDWLEAEPSHPGESAEPASWTVARLRRACAPGERTWWIAQVAEVGDLLALRTFGVPLGFDAVLLEVIERAGGEVVPTVPPEVGTALHVPPRHVGRGSVHAGPDEQLVRDSAPVLGLGPDGEVAFELVDEGTWGTWVHRLPRPIPDRDDVRALRGYRLRRDGVTISAGASRFEGPPPAEPGSAQRPARRGWLRRG